MRTLKKMLVMCLIARPGFSEPSPRIAALLLEQNVGPADTRTYQQRLDEYRLRSSTGDLLLDACRRNPIWVWTVYERLPDRQDTYDFMLSQSKEPTTDDSDFRLKERLEKRREALVWLRRRSNHLRTELVTAARGGDWRDFRALMDLDPPAAIQVGLSFPERSCFRLVTILKQHPNDADTLRALRHMVFDETANPADRYEASVELGASRWAGQIEFMKAVAKLDRVGKSSCAYDLFHGWVKGAPERWHATLKVWTASQDPRLSYHSEDCLTWCYSTKAESPVQNGSNKLGTLTDLAEKRTGRPGAFDSTAYAVLRQVDPGPDLIRNMETEAAGAPAPVANQIQGMIGEWFTDDVDNYILEKLLDDSIQERLLEKLRHHKANLVRMGGPQLMATLPLGGERAGLATYLLGDERLHQELLKSTDNQARQAFLAMARLEQLN